MNKQSTADWLRAMRDKAPLVHNITNTVAASYTANGLLAAGASPVMAEAKEEVAQMVAIADALVLNIGTLTKEKVDAMITAGQAANQKGIPVLLDPVGAGATSFRTDSARLILKEVAVDVLRGNAGEIAVLCGKDVAVKGVDGGGAEPHHALAKEAANRFGLTCVITGKDDVAADMDVTFTVSNGVPLLSRVTGTGCLLGAVIAAFCAVDKSYAHASAAALAYYGVAAEQAFQVSGNKPGQFAAAFLDALYETAPEDLVIHSQIKEGFK